VNRSLDDLRRATYHSGGETLIPLAEYALARIGAVDQPCSPTMSTPSLPSQAEAANEAFTSAPAGDGGECAMTGHDSI